MAWWDGIAKFALDRGMGFGLALDSLPDKYAVLAQQLFAKMDEQDSDRLIDFLVDNKDSLKNEDTRTTLLLSELSQPESSLVPLISTFINETSKQELLSDTLISPVLEELAEKNPLMKNILNSIASDDFSEDEFKVAANYIVANVDKFITNDGDLAEDIFTPAITAYQTEPAVAKAIEPAIRDYLKDTGLTKNEHILTALKTADSQKVVTLLGSFTTSDAEPDLTTSSLPLDGLNTLLASLDESQTKTVFDWALDNQAAINNGTIIDAVITDITSTNSQLTSVIEPLVTERLAAFGIEDSSAIITTMKSMDGTELKNIITDALALDVSNPESITAFMVKHRNQTELLDAFTQPLGLPKALTSSIATMDEGTLAQTISWGMENRDVLASRDTAAITALINNDLTLGDNSQLAPTIIHVLENTPKDDLMNMPLFQTAITSFAAKSEENAALVTAFDAVTDEEFKAAVAHIKDNRTTVFTEDGLDIGAMLASVKDASPGFKGFVEKMLPAGAAAAVVATANKASNAVDATADRASSVAEETGDKIQNFVRNNPTIVTQLAESVHESDSWLVSLGKTAVIKAGILPDGMAEPELDAMLSLVKGPMPQDTAKNLTWLLQHTDKFAAMKDDFSIDKLGFIIDDLADPASPAHAIVANMQSPEGKAALRTLLPASVTDDTLNAALDQSTLAVSMAQNGQGELLKTVLADADQLGEVAERFKQADLSTLPGLMQALNTPLGNNGSVPKLAIAAVQTLTQDEAQATNNIRGLINNEQFADAKAGIVKELETQIVERAKKQGLNLKLEPDNAKNLVNYTAEASLTWLGNWTNGRFATDFPDLPTYDPNTELTTEQLAQVQTHAASYVRATLDANAAGLGPLGKKVFGGLPELLGIDSNPLDYVMGTNKGASKHELNMGGLLSVALTSAAGTDTAKGALLDANVAHEVAAADYTREDIKTGAQAIWEKHGGTGTVPDEQVNALFAGVEAEEENGFSKFLKDKNGWQAFALAGAAGGFLLGQQMGLGFFGSLFVAAIGYAVGAIAGADGEMGGFQGFGLSKALGEKLGRSFGGKEIPEQEKLQNALQELPAEQLPAGVDAAQYQADMAKAISEARESRVKDKLGVNTTISHPQGVPGTDQVVDNGVGSMDAAAQAAAQLRSSGTVATTTNTPGAPPPTHTTQSVDPDLVAVVTR